MGNKLKNSIKDEAIYWVTCEKEGLNNQQKSDFEAWIKQNNEHKKAFDEAKNIYTIFQNIPTNYAQNLSNKAHKGAKKIKFFEKTIKPLVVCACIIFVSIIGYKTFIPEYQKDYKTLYTSLKKELLPDGSTIYIDTKSNLEIEFFKNKREVILKEGQVLFEIAKDKNRPFIITAGKTLIEVVGTKFEVKNIENITTISVEEGLVKVDFIRHLLLPTQEITLLKKGEQIVIDNSGKINFVGQTQTEEIASWKNDELIFRKTSLKEAFKTFARYQDLDIEFKDKSFENKLFSGKFNTLGIDNFLFAIQKIYPINILKNQNKIIIN